MKAHFKTRTVTIEVEGATLKELFKAIAEVQEVFEADSACGACNSTAIQFHVRDHDGNTYYKLRCQECDATLDFGQRKQGGGLFPRRYDTESKETLPNRGWRKWSKKTEETWE